MSQTDVPSPSPTPAALVMQSPTLSSKQLHLPSPPIRRHGGRPRKLSAYLRTPPPFCLRRRSARLTTLRCRQDSERLLEFCAHVVGEKLQSTFFFLVFFNCSCSAFQPDLLR
jgi:hypothetical protein